MEAESTDAPAVYDHYRPAADGDLPDAVYRVVGVVDGEVALLRVTDGDGSRRGTGDLRRVPVPAVDDSLRPAENPDAGWGIVEYLAGGLIVAGLALAVAVPAVPAPTGVAVAAAGAFVLWQRR